MELQELGAGKGEEKPDREKKKEEKVEKSAADPHQQLHLLVLEPPEDMWHRCSPHSLHPPAVVRYRFTRLGLLHVLYFHFHKQL